MKNLDNKKIVKMDKSVPDLIIQISRDLRKNLTKAERIIWGELKNKKIGYKFLRQKPIYLYTEYSGLDSPIGRIG